MKLRVLRRRYGCSAGEPWEIAQERLKALPADVTEAQVASRRSRGSRQSRRTSPRRFGQAPGNIGKASEMVAVARLADHYEKRGVNDALAVAEHDLIKLKHDAPKLWRHLYESNMSDREIGDWVYEFIVEWMKSGMSFRNFAAEREDNIISTPSAITRRRYGYGHRRSR